MGGGVEEGFGEEGTEVGRREGGRRAGKGDISVDKGGEGGAGGVGGKRRGEKERRQCGEGGPIDPRVSRDGIWLRDFWTFTQFNSLPFLLS